jgi:OOP family OmpA-OmpF porin
MKKVVVLLIFLTSLSFGQSIFKTVEGATNSGITEGSAVSDENRPDGFIIKHVKDEVVFNEDGKVLDKDGKIKLIRLNVKFDFDKYDIKDEYKYEISEAVEFLNKHKTLTAIIEGHTDSVGTYEYNYSLSKLRAKTIAQALRVSGIDKNRIKTEGFGETVPIATNENDKGRALNRRVDISFNK